MFSLFKKPRVAAVQGNKPRAAVFVDYEHWYISMDKLFNARPDIKAWRDEMSKKYDLQEIAFFGDFSNLSLRAEISRIREVTSMIIETQNASAHHKKDFTDFIMLDHIYQKAMMTDNIDTFIIFSGDGHFSSVVSFLVNRLHKEVGVYAVKEAVSSQLRNTASWIVELPHEDNRLNLYQLMVLRHLKRLEQSGKGKRLTFWATVETISKDNNMESDLIATAMRDLIEKGYVFQKRQTVRGTQNVKLLCVDWAKLSKDRIKI